jgi:quinol monooxygenase YgiN
VELTIFGRFHARPGQEGAVGVLIEEVASRSRAEPGCRSIRAYRSTQDPALFFIHSVWVDEGAFELHATLPHTARFLDAVGPLLDHPPSLQRAASLT